MTSGPFQLSVSRGSNL